MIDWIADNMGCGVCVHMACGDETMGGCLPCAEPTAAARDSGAPSPSPCVIAPAEINRPSWDIQVQPTSDKVVPDDATRAGTELALQAS